MILVIEQPSYIPWLGYFDLLAQAEVWVWYDDVQYTTRDWRNRNRVARAGDPIWLTVPVRGGGRDRTIDEVTIDSSRPWARKQLATFRHCYGDAPFFEVSYDLLRRHIERGYERLVDLVIDLDEAIAGTLGLTRPFRRSSGLEGIAGRKQERLLSVCRAMGATVYLSGPAARSYIDPRGFAEAGIELRYIHYEYPPYPRGGQPFIPGLSILDALAWIGPAATTELLAGAGRYVTTARAGQE